MSDLPELLERYRRGAEILAMSLTGAAGPELDFQTEPGKWSVRQIVCHLSDAEMVTGTRLRRIIAEDDPTLEAFNQDAWAHKLDYAKRKPSQALETFRRLRGENHDLLKDLAEETFARTGTHSERGTVSLLDLVKGGAEHAENHIRQMREVRAIYKEQRAIAKAAAAESAS